MVSFTSAAGQLATELRQLPFESMATSAHTADIAEF